MLPAVSQFLAALPKRRVITIFALITLITISLQLTRLDAYSSVREYVFPQSASAPTTPPNVAENDDRKFRWQDLLIQYPVESLIPLPTASPVSIPRIQHQPKQEDDRAKRVRLERLESVKEAFEHAWRGYKQNAWMADEVGPLSAIRHNFFGGWAASLVDALDTLWIMDMKEDFAEAVKAIEQIDFTGTEEAELNTFETTIRYMGGFLGAYDLSGRQYPALLEKAKELGEMLLVAFDTPNRMPITRWHWAKARDGEKQEAGTNVLSAELGSLSLEFTRLSQITKDGRYYDAVQRIMNHFEDQQMKTRLPGMWPIDVNARDLDFSSDFDYTIGAMADSLYEYLPKQHMLLGGRTDQYRNMYEHAADVFTKHNFYRPMTQDNADILFSALAQAEGGDNEPVLDGSMQHLVCFAGGMVAIGAKIFNRIEDLNTARKLVDGCIWAYGSLQNGIMAEVSHHIPCIDSSACQWNETRWHDAIMSFESAEDRSSGVPYEERLARRIQGQRLQAGYVAINDRRYILRPEAIESIFILYRITGDSTYQDKAWTMFEAIQNSTRTEIANAALDDITVTPPTKADRMESFFMAETLKYFYLTFSDPGVVSLDEYVFNTEAHPFRRPTR